MGKQSQSGKPQTFRFALLTLDNTFYLCTPFLENRIQIMAKKSKANRVQVILECTEHKDSGLPGTSRYITTKNRRNTSARLELKKYNPILRRYTLHKEIK